MGFETQEEAERWAENAEFLADQAKEEKLLASIDALKAPFDGHIDTIWDVDDTGNSVTLFFATTEQMHAFYKAARHK